MKNLIVVIIMLVFVINAGAQQRLTCKVVSGTNQIPLSGVTIRVSGTKSLIHSDLNGSFSLFIKIAGDTLEFSHLGYYKKQFFVRPPIDSKVLLVKMEPEEHVLEGVNIVSSGYQKIPKERTTGSFSYIDQNVLNQQVGTTVLSRLEAVANGLFADRSSIAGGGNLVIRGQSTIRGPKGALIVLDNFPYEGSLDNINPNDIENITVLKDAAATSIWGARAGNGVIVITTKKGKFNQPLLIEFNANNTMLVKPDLNYIRQISIADFIDLEEFLYAKGKYNSKINSTYAAALTPIVELLVKKTKGELTQSAYEGQKASFMKDDVRDQYYKYLYKQGLNQQYALNLKGGSVNHSWNLSTGYDYNSSVSDEKYNRINLRFQNTIKPIERLEITAGIFYTQSKNITGKPAYGAIGSGSALYPYARFADNNGNPLPVVADTRLSYLDTAGRGRLLDWKYYPLDDYKHSLNTTMVNDVLVNAGLSYKIVRGLSADVKYQFERQQTNGQNLRNKDSYFARNLVNSYTQLLSGQEAIYKVPKGGVLDLSNMILHSQNLRSQLNYNELWIRNEINFIAGAEVRDLKNTSDQSRVYGYNDELLNYGNVDYLTQFPDFRDGTLSYITDNRGLGQNVNRFISFYTNGSYTYNGRYTISLSCRRDASNLFGLNTNDKWNPLWSAGASWNLSKEGFYHFDAIPYLRFRSTYGFSGNTDPAMSAVTTISYVRNSPFTPSPYAVFSNYYNPELTWERSAMLNLGFDFRVNGNWLTGSLEFFTKRGTNLFGRGLLDYTGGAGASIIKNAAATKGYGVDLELNSSNLSIGNFNWSSNLNASFYKDEVVQYYLPQQSAGSYINISPVISGVSGKPVYSVYSYKWAGLNPLNGNPRGYVNGMISENYTLITGSSAKLEDLIYHGSALPVFYGSLGNTFTYKGFSITARLIYKLGYYFRRSSVSYGNLFDKGLGHSDYAQRWQHPGDENFTNVPSLVYPNSSSRDTFYNGSEVLVDRGDHVRLQYLNFSYQLNNQQMKFLPFRNMSVYVNAANLGLIWKANKNDIDPDYQLGNVLKPSKTFSLGIKGNLN